MDYRTVMLHIDYGRGRAGYVLGPPCSIYRVTAASSGNYLDPAQLLLANQYLFKRINKDKVESPERSMGSLFFEFIADATNLLTGDVCVENDPFYGAGDTIVDYSTTQFEGFCIAYHGPIKTTIAARIDRVGLIYRPVEAIDNSNYWSPTLSTGQVAPLQLTDGVFGFGAVGDPPTQVPMGLMSMPRTFRPSFKDLPGDTNSTQWFCYLPPLDGYTPRAGDRIINDSNSFSTGSRYVVIHPYEQEAGVQGSQLVLEREIDPG